MNASEALERGRRALAEIESDLTKAEDAFADADARIKRAERDRRAALDTIDKHQMELDKVIAELRQRSIAGSKWRIEIMEAEATLDLQAKDIMEDEDKKISNDSGLVSADASEVLAANFERLKACSQAEVNDPLLKVVVSPRT